MLEGEDDFKDLIVDVVEKRMGGRRIVATRLIYQYDVLNRMNFHKYIDNKEQLVIVIKLVNGNVLGAWTEGSFFSKMVSEKDGVIFSFTNRKVF